MAIRLQYTADTTVPIEADCITPDRLRGLSRTEIAKLPCLFGNRERPLDDFFDISGEATDGEIVLNGACRNVKWVGAEMATGRITIHGSIGMHLGSEMTGGEIIVHGDAGDWVGAEMIGGKIHVHGSAGHLVGAGYRGSRLGMRGGTILIDGDVKNELGAIMRRGLIAVGGRTGDYAGVSMIAGSIFVFGETGIRVGAGMKRGTIGLFDGSDRLGDNVLLPTFSYSCTYAPEFLPIYVRQLAAWGLPIGEPDRYRVVERYNGDLVSLGKGEILRWRSR
jgi:formylmethanofuran dehydrogenase subunit C